MSDAPEKAAEPGVFSRTVDYLTRPVDIASLVFIRIAFGLVMLWEVWRYFDKGWIYDYWMDPEFNFTYFGFDWLAPWPGDGMLIHFAVMGVLAFMITFGLAYRLVTFLFFLALSYTFLLEQARYLNHMYLACLLSFLMILVPAHRSTSLGTKLKLVKPCNTTPFWTIWVLRLQLGVVYFYGGLAKINPDWIQGEPMRTWLERREDTTLIGPLLAHDTTIFLFIYGGLLFDLAVVPMLLWRRTRVLAFILAFGFHLTNAIVWSIGIFPVMGIALTTIFFSPSWPRRLFCFSTYEKDETTEQSESSRAGTVMVTLVLVYSAVQLIVPFRHFLYPGHVSWTEEGHKYSWRMKLRARGGTTVFYVKNNETSERFRVDPEEYLTSWQRDKMDTQPDMILQFTQYLQKIVAEEEDWDDVSITAKAMVSLNGRARQVFVDPETDLTKEKRSLAHKPWIMPLHEPLPDRKDGEEEREVGVPFLRD